MYRYRCETGATRKALERLDKLKNIGAVVKIKGYRFRSNRKDNNGNWWSGLHERVMVYGTDGTARFSDFLWGYGGEGPRGLVELLLRCGASKEWAESIAFYSERKNEVGTDWEIQLRSAA